MFTTIRKSKDKRSISFESFVRVGIFQKCDVVNTTNMTLLIMQSIIDIIRILLFLHLLNLLLLLSFRTIFLYEQIRKNIDNLIVIRSTKCCFFLMFFFISRLSSVDSLLNTRHLLIPIVIIQA